MLGADWGSHNGPKLGHRVEAGPGVAIFSGGKIGDGTATGPNTVIMADVPAWGRVFVETPRMIRLPDMPSTGRKDERL
jgi:serine acetyltransferase